MSFVSNIPGQVTTVVTPPANYEISEPFRADANGHIAVISNTVSRAIQHLLTLAMTSPGERLMRPTFGVGIKRMVFENTDLGQFQEAALALQQAYSTLEGSIVNVKVVVIQAVGGVYLFQVSFTLDQSPQVHQAVFDYAGNLVGSS